MSFFKDDKHLLTKARDRISYIYVEYARLEQTNFSVAIIQGNRVAEIPITTIGAVFLGPGTTITHEAVKNFAAAGVSLIWCGAEEWRIYVAGAPCTNSAKNILIQMRCHESKTKHMEIVRKMYNMRYPDEHFSRKTLTEMRGIEGDRMKKTYKEMSEKYDVEWYGRKYKVDSPEESDDVNRALTIGNQVLYGIIRSVLHLTGFSTAIGFIHTGHMFSFVYDMADLYKEKLVIPLAFECALEPRIDSDKWMRTRMREEMTNMHFMSQVTKDLKCLFDTEDAEVSDIELALWDYKTVVNAGINYGNKV